jgi:hypothetical protein
MTAFATIRICPVLTLCVGAFCNREDEVTLNWSARGQ